MQAAQTESENKSFEISSKIEKKWFTNREGYVILAKYDYFRAEDCPYARCQADGDSDRMLSTR